MNTTLSLTKTQTIILLALMAAAAIALRYAESFIPVAGQFAAKPGLPNIITLTCMYLFSFKLTALYLAVRMLLTALLFTGLFTPAFFIGTTGTILSLVIMYAAKRSNLFSIHGVSVAGACAHNTGQLVMAGILMQSSELFNLWPLIIALSVPFGLFTGFAAAKLLRALKNTTAGLRPL